MPKHNSLNKPLLLERLEDRILLNAALPSTGPVPDADVLIDQSQDFLLNEEFNFAVDFENASTEPTAAGYQPYVDVVVEAGVNITSTSGATQIGSTLYWDATDGQWEDVADGSGAVVSEHPLTALALAPGGSDGDQLLIFEYPFGSFVPGQPAGLINFTAELDPDIGTNLGNAAEVGTALNISATGGFARGADQNVNPDADPPLIGCADVETITPAIIELVKTTDQAENEVTTGENYPVTFILELDVADGQTVTNVNISDSFPAGFIITAPVTVTTATGATPDGTSDLDASDGSFSVDFATFTAAAGDDIVDITVEYTGYFDDSIPDNNGNNNDDVLWENDSVASVDFEGSTYVDDEADTDIEIELGLLKVQKSVSVLTDPGNNGATSGDTLLYRFDFQVSDYTSFKDLLFYDVLGDGLEIIPLTAQYTITESSEVGGGISGNFAAGNEYVLVGGQPPPFTFPAGTSPGAFETGVVFDLSNQLIADASNGVLVGDLADGVNSGVATTGFITFQARILQNFRDAGVGDISVDISDVLNNDVVIEGTATDPTGIEDRDQERDTSAASIQSDGGEVTKELIAIEGVVGDETVGTGESVTYRLRFEVPTADLENFTLTDYLPLPVFDVANNASGLVFDAGNTFDPNNPAAFIPASGTAVFTTEHNLASFTGVQAGGEFATPMISVNPNSNSYEFNFGTFDSVDEGSAVVDIVFTLDTEEVFIADGLFLTNQTLAQFNDTSSEGFSEQDIVMIGISAPEIEVTKSVVSVDRTDLIDPEAGYGFQDPGNAGIPFTAPITTASLLADEIDSDLTGIDAGDAVKFAIVIHNTGSLDAHDILISDVLPAAGYDLPNAGNINLQIYSGDGTLLSTPNAALDLFSTGIRITDPAGSAPVGALGAGVSDQGTSDPSDDVDNATGSNVIIITYDLIAADDIQAATAQTNTASLDEYAGQEGGTDLTLGNTLAQWEDDATTVANSPEVAKFFVDSSEGSTTGNDLTVGEVATYEIVVFVPEGEVPNLQLADQVPPGLAYVAGSAQIITQSGAFSPTTSANLTNNFNGNVTLVTATSGGGNGDPVVFDIVGMPGDLFAVENTGNADNSFVIRFDMVVLNDATNVVSGMSITNTAELTFTDNDGADNDPLTGSEVVTETDDAIIAIVVPELEVLKVITPSPADAGDTVTLTLTVNNNGSSDAFDVVLTDLIDTTKFTNITEGTTPAGFTYDFNGITANTVTYTAGVGVAIPDGGSAVFTFTAMLEDDVIAGEIISNTANVTGDTLPGNDPNERDVTDDGTGTVTIASPSAVKNFIGTSINDTSPGIDNDNTEVVIGENVIYELVITIPEGVSSDVTIADTLDAGLAFAQLVSVTRSSAALTTDFGAGDFSDAVPAVGAVGNWLTAVNAGANNQAQVASFNLGTITNSDTVNATAETITIRYEATVLNVAANQSTANEAGPSLGNSAVVSFDVNGTPTSNAPVSSPTDVTIIEPIVTTDKSVVVNGAGTAGDNGDTVVYTIRVENIAANGSETAAFDIDFSDDIPDEIINIVTPLTLNTNSASVAIADFSFVAGTNVITTVGDIDLELGEFFELTITGEIANNVTPGQMLTNTASTDYSSEDGVQNDNSAYVNDGTDDERDGADGEGGALNDYSDEDDAVIAINQIAPVKSVVASSESSTVDPNVAIGEIVRYRLLVEIPETSLVDFQLRDNLPDGMIFLNDGTAFAAIVSDTITSTSTLPNDPALFVGADPGANALTFMLPDANVSSTALGNTDAYLSGTDVFFKLGDFVNSDSDANAEFVIIEFNALVENIVANQEGVDLTNDFVVLNNGAQLGPDSNDITVNIVEPDINLIKAVATPAPTDAGDTVSYTFTITNSNAADTGPGFDINLTDTLNTNIQLTSIVFTAGATGASLDTTASDAVGTVGANIDVVVDQLDPGESVTVTVNGTLIAATPVGLQVDNTADITYTSLPDDNGTDPNPTGSNPPGNSGDADGERGGDGNGANDYNDDGNASFTLDTPTIDKIDPVPTNFTIGDLVTYSVLVTLPEGVTQSLTVIDNLPIGLTFQAGSIQIITSAAASGSLLANDYAGTIAAPGIVNGGASGDDLTLNFGNTTTADDNNTNNNTFLVQYQALVDNIAGNINGQTLQNAADLQYTNPNNGMTETVDDPTDPIITVVEPRLIIDKSVNDTTPNYGDILTYTVRVEHDQDLAAPDSTTTAFDLIITDTITSPGLTLVDNSVIIVSSAGATGTVITDQVGDIQIDVASLALGGVLEFTYQVTVTNDPGTFALGSNLPNTAELDYDSQAGVNPNDRTYEDDDPESVTIVGADLAVTKDDGAVALTPGSTTTYNITINNNGTDTASGVTVTDTLPAGLSFNAASNGGAETAPGSGIIVWNLPDIAAGAPAVVLTLTVDVDDPAPAGFTTYTNSVTVGHDDVEPTPVDNTDNDVDTINAAPNLAIDKAVVGGPAFAPGDPVQYTITITNIGDQNASGVIVTDTFPTTELTFLSVGPDVVGMNDHTLISFAGGIITWDLATVETNETIVLTVNAVVNNPLPNGTVDFTNSVSVADDGMSNPDSDPMNNDDDETAPILAFPDIAVEKTNNVDRIQPLDNVSYEILVQNLGDQNSVNVTVVDFVDVTIFENIVPSAMFLVSFDAATGRVEWLIPAIMGGGSEQFLLTVNADVKINTPPGIDVVENTVMAMDDGTNGPDSDPSNNDFTDTDELVVYAFDGVRDEVFDNNQEEDEFRNRVDERFQDPLNITTFYSGWTEPGSTLKFKIFDENGNELGEQVVVADTAGNWVANFANVYITDEPHNMTVAENQPIYNSSTEGSFNLRTYFAPAHHGQVFFLHTPTVDSVFSNTAENVMQSIHHSLTNPIQLGWSDTYGYEALTSSSTTTQTRE
jgi:uncharacterized repeat protein (TIGR01451 family)/fimbrial isopeptide formation D2 family protein